MRMRVKCHATRLVVLFGVLGGKLSVPRRQILSKSRTPRRCEERTSVKFGLSRGPSPFRALWRYTVIKYHLVA